MDAIEQTHSLRLAQSTLVADACQEEMTKIQHPPPGWSLEADEELARFMVQHAGKGINGGGGGNEFVKKTEASSLEVRPGDTAYVQQHSHLDYIIIHVYIIDCIV